VAEMSPTILQPGQQPRHSTTFFNNHSRKPDSTSTDQLEDYTLLTLSSLLDSCSCSAWMR
jgi:hypothetical protein